MDLIKLMGTDIELTDALKNYVNEKMSLLEKHLHSVGTPKTIEVEIGKTTNHHKNGPFFRAEGNIVIPGAQFYADAESDDLYASIDLLRDELDRQLKDHQEKFQTRDKQEGARLKELTHTSEVLLEQEGKIE